MISFFHKSTAGQKICARFAYSFCSWIWNFIFMIKAWSIPFVLHVSKISYKARKNMHKKLRKWTTENNYGVVWRFCTPSDFCSHETKITSNNNMILKSEPCVCQNLKTITRFKHVLEQRMFENFESCWIPMPTVPKCQSKSSSFWKQEYTVFKKDPPQTYPNWKKGR